MKARGFTLIEVLAATTLAAFLMLAVLRVTSTLPRAQEIMDQTQDKSPVSSRVLSLLRYDLENARMLRHAGGGIVLDGSGGLDPLSNRTTHLPSSITYRVAVDGKASWLMREQELSDGSHSVTRELVCPNVTGIEIRRVTETGTATPATASIDGEIPGIVVVTLQFGHDSIDQRMVLR